MNSKAQDFVHYLNHTLIPDLKQSGLTATAEDFEEAVEHIKHPHEGSIVLSYDHLEQVFPYTFLQVNCDGFTFALDNDTLGFNHLVTVLPAVLNLPLQRTFTSKAFTLWTTPPTPIVYETPA